MNERRSVESVNKINDSEDIELEANEELVIHNHHKHAGKSED
jgi:hypothetical protein